MESEAQPTQKKSVPLVEHEDYEKNMKADEGKDDEGITLASEKELVAADFSQDEEERQDVDIDIEGENVEVKTGAETTSLDKSVRICFHHNEMMHVNRVQQHRFW
jgi:hypothetical protein